MSTSAELRERKGVQEALAFLRHIDRVVVTGTHFEDDVEFLDLEVVMRADAESDSSSSIAANHIARKVESSAASSHALSEKHAKKERKKLRPSVDFHTSKAVTTLELVHTAIYEWSRKPHEGDAAGPCAYCSQFNSPAALAMWTKKRAREVLESASTGLSVVVHNDRLRQYEQCINSYLESARRVPLDSDVASSCEGVAHIPSIVANLVQSVRLKTVAYSALHCVVT